MNGVFDMLRDVADNVEVQNPLDFGDYSLDMWLKYPVYTPEHSGWYQLRIYDRYDIYDMGEYAYMYYDNNQWYDLTGTVWDSTCEPYDIDVEFRKLVLDCL